MKMVCRILFLLFIALGASSMNAHAQTKRAEKTSSAKAYYGQRPAKPHYKQKKSKQVKTVRSQSAKRARADVRNRKKYS